MATTQEDIFGPFLVMQLLCMTVWFFLFSKRIPFLFAYMDKNKPKMEDIGDPSSKHYLPNITPSAVRNPSDNWKNLSEVPTLFYAMVGYLYMTHTVDTAYVRAAWVFCVFRCLHSAIHCTFNKVDTRFQAYLVSSLSLWYMVVRACIQYFL